MTQEQFNFLKGFKTYLQNRGFQVSDTGEAAEAIARAELYGSIPVVCRFTWKWLGDAYSVQFQIQLGNIVLERNLLIALLMDYKAVGRDVFEGAIRNMTNALADEIVHQFFKPKSCTL